MDVEMKDSSVQPSGLGGGDTGLIGDTNKSGKEGDGESGHQEDEAVQEDDTAIITQDSGDSTTSGYDNTTEDDFKCSFSTPDAWDPKVITDMWGRGPQRYAMENALQPYSSRDLFSDWEGSIQPVIDLVISSLRKPPTYILDIKGWEYLFAQWTRYEESFIPRTMEYYLVLGMRLAITDISDLNVFGAVDECGNEFLQVNNITNAWRAAYNLYGAVWCHGVDSDYLPTAKIKFVPLDNEDEDLGSQTSEDDDSSEEEASNDDEDTVGSRSLGSEDSECSWESALSAASASLYPTTCPRLQQKLMSTTDLDGLKYSTIFKGRLQTIVVSGRKAQEEAALNDFEEIVTALFDLDKSCTILPWRQGNSEGINKSNINKNMPTNKRDLMPCVWDC